MAKRLIYFDKSEVVLIVPGKKGSINYNLVSNAIQRIDFEKKEKRLLGIIPQESETITLVASNVPEPIVYTKKDHKVFFEQYKEDFRKYAKDYRIPLNDYTQ